MSQSIFLAASMNFYKELVKIGETLEKKGWKVYIPVSAQMMKEKNDFDAASMRQTISYPRKAEIIQINFKKIAVCDSLLVINGEKNGIKGYIGANVLMEIGLAFYLGKKIYILNPIGENAPYMEELRAFQVEFINGDVKKIM